MKFSLSFVINPLDQFLGDNTNFSGLHDIISWFILLSLHVLCPSTQDTVFLTPS